MVGNFFVSRDNLFIIHGVYVVKLASSSNLKRVNVPRMLSWNINQTSDSSFDSVHLKIQATVAQLCANFFDRLGQFAKL